MTFELEDFSDAELLHVIACEKLKLLYPILKEEKRNRLQQFSLCDLPQKSTASKLFQALSIPLTDANNFPLILLWSAVGIVTLGALSLLVGTIILALLSLIIGGLIVYTNYKEINSAEKKFRDFYKLYLIKNLAADTYLARHGLKIDLEDRPTFHNKTQLSLIKESLRTAMLIATPLFGTYFLGVNALLTVFHATLFATVLSGVPGLAIGLTIALIIGVVCAYHHYQSCLEDKRLHFNKKVLIKEFNQKKELATGLYDKAITLTENELTSSKPIISQPAKNMTFKYTQIPQRFFKGNPNVDQPQEEYRIQLTQ